MCLQDLDSVSMCFEFLQEEDNKKQQESILCDAADAWVLTDSHNVCTSETQKHNIQQIVAECVCETNAY